MEGFAAESPRQLLGPDRDEHLTGILDSNSSTEVDRTWVT